jgi:uncharacterized membrane protein
MNEVQQNQVWLRQLVRIYVTGLIVTAIALFIWKVVFQYSPWFDILENPVWAGGLTFISIVILPLILGSIIRFGVSPVLGKWHKWTELMSLEDRIVGELEKGRKPEIVIINWPSTTVQTVGILTARFPATETQPEMAAVFHPSSPRGKTGYMRIVNVSDLQFTAWTIHEFQAFNLTLGAIHPDHLVVD